MAKTLTEVDAERARRVWAEFQKDHDLSGLIGQTAGIDPAGERIWFGESAKDIWLKMQREGVDCPIYCVRVGDEYYLRKGGHR